MKDTNSIHNSLIYIEDHLEENLTIGQIADAIGYSEYYFSRSFRKEMQMTVMEYVRKRRLKKSFDEIKKGEKVIDTAIKFGWETHSGFTKSFKNEFGFSPSVLKAIMMHIEILNDDSVYIFNNEGKNDCLSKELLVRSLKEELTLRNILFNSYELDRIYAEALSVYSDLKRYSGEEYITHVLYVAIILAKMNATIEVIYAGLFCDIRKVENISIERLKNVLPVEVRKIVEFLLKENNEYDITSKEEAVILIKLAGRLHNMKTIEFLDLEKRTQKVKETLRMILPFIKRLGRTEAVIELYNLTLKYYDELNIF